jgi:anti-sigma28 factor (negative regulator of flagellin synthesis)
MDNVGPISRTRQTLAANGNQAARQPEQASAPSRTSDRVELSRTARMLSKTVEVPVRQDLIDRVRAEINAGTYENPQRIDAAIDNMASDLI